MGAPQSRHLYFQSQSGQGHIETIRKRLSQSIAGLRAPWCGQFLRKPAHAVNHYQPGIAGQGPCSLSDTGRLLLNSTVGIGGLFDPATSAGLEQHHEDFGQTLATWGVPDGPFVMLPLLGPRTLRDALTIPLNLFAHPLYHYENTSVRDKLWGLEAINVRARLLAADTLLEDSFDPYLTIRDAYQQNRRYLIYDGEPPEDYDEYLDEFLEEEPAVRKDAP